jgi:hypothetical protein
MVNSDSAAATVKFDPDKANVAALLHATTNAGFPSATHQK